MTASRIACCTNASVAEITQQKRDLRRSLLAARECISIDARTDNDQAISAAVIDWFAAHPVQTLGIYWPMRGEPDLREAYATLAAQGIALALPLSAIKNTPLRFAAWKPGDALRKDALGISVPESTALVVRPDALLIPCVGFNADRIRLGYGGGYYDRTLANDPKPLAIGVAYMLSLAQFPGEAHDIPLDAILTECGDPTALKAAG